MVELVCIDFDCSVILGVTVEMWYCEIHRILREYLYQRAVSRIVDLRDRSWDP